MPDATALRDEIHQAVQGKSVTELRIGIESTSVYSFHPSMFLHNDEFIQALGGQVFVMNPKQIANFKKSYSDMDKTDEIDAFVIADYMRFGRLPMSVVKEEQYVALQQLTRATYCSSLDRKSTRLNSSHVAISYAVFCLKKKNKKIQRRK